MNSNSHRFSSLDLVYIALAAALISICSWISIPTVVPFTLQTFAIFCILSLLGGRRGTLAILLYLILGAVGLPVFSRFTAGPGVLFGNTGGYLLGFLLTGLCYWLMISLLGKKLWVEIIACLIGMFLYYAFGTAWFMIVYARTSGAIGLKTALSLCVLPFLIPDLIKLGLGLGLARRIPLSL